MTYDEDYFAWGYSRERNALNGEFWAEFVRDLPDGANILLVYFSREADELPKLLEEDSDRIQEHANGRGFTFIVADEASFLDQLKVADAVFIRGGETKKLMDAVRKHPGFADAIEGKTLAGSSAGAYLFARHYRSAGTGTMGEGLGILPIRVLCHYQSKIFDVGEDALKAMDEFPNDLELVVLRDYEHRVFLI